MSYKSISIAILMFCFGWLTLQCQKKQIETEEEFSFRLLSFYGVTFYPFSVLDNHERFSYEDSGEYVTVPVKNGDLVVFKLDKTNNEYIYSIDPEWKDTLIFDGDENTLLINGKLSSITIDSIGPSLMFLHQLSLQESKTLKSIEFEIEIPDSVKPYLQKIAEFNPHIDISFTGYEDSIPVNNQDLLWISQHFSPKMLSINNPLDSLTLTSIGRFKNLESLMIFIPDSIGDLPLPHLEKLKKLILREWNETDQFPLLKSSFFQENLQIKSFTFVGDGEDLESLPPWYDLKQLEELNIMFWDDAWMDYPLAYVHPNLKALTVVGQLENAADISNLKQLKRLSLRSQESYLKDNLPIFADSLKELEFLDFNVVDTLFDYRILGRFKELKYLIIGDSEYSSSIDSGLFQLKGLQYLSLHEDFYSDSLGIVNLKSELPNTIIVPNSGACIGSVWLLLIIPIALFWFLLLRTYHKKEAYAP
ncbi:hypothetical protein [Shivajiella indica]|uniref:Leucine-rich repeat domain-containing protein n=1 Tax=Shivajiella indica TaxID=872115 RepID=A0ABW5BDV1_9BACT